jgi:hypothetical protein
LFRDYIFNRPQALRRLRGLAQGRTAAGRARNKPALGSGGSIEAGGELLLAKVAGFSLDQHAILDARG